MSENLYRPCVGIALFDKQGKVFVGERIDTPGAWQMPQGGIDENEDLTLAAFRELKEEIGTDKAEILQIMDEKIRYETPLDIRDRLQKIWGKPYIGQEQTWIAMRFMGQDSDIDLEADNHPEFSQWQWVNLDKIIDLIVPFKRNTYKILIREFREFSITD